MKRLFALLMLAAAGCTASSERSDWERRNEGRLEPAAAAPSAPPAYPREGDLIEFYVAATSEFRFFVDPASVSVPGVAARANGGRSSRAACSAGTTRFFANISARSARRSRARPRPWKRCGAAATRDARAALDCRGG